MGGAKSVDGGISSLSASSEKVTVELAGLDLLLSKCC
jgi:hypothetical protein